MSKNEVVTKFTEAPLLRWQKISEQMRDVVTPILKNAEKFIKPYKSILSQIEELTPNTKEALILLGNHGWYLDLEMHMPFLWELKKALEEGSVQEAESALSQFFEERLGCIEESIIKCFPRRKKIIGAAFSAHRRCEYELSVPVLLSQTDGICKDVVNRYFFIKKDGKPETAGYVEQIVTDSYYEALLSPLAHSQPIGASKNERGSGFVELNRHMVLHGESLDYGTEINSLKAISLINYVAHVLDVMKTNSNNG